MERRKKGTRIRALLLSLAVTVSSLSIPQSTRADEVADTLVFQNFEADSVDSSASGTLSTDEHHGGNKSLKYVRNSDKGWWDVTFKSPLGETVDVSAYSYITFWVKTDKTNAIEVKLFSEGKDTNKRTTATAKAGEWTFMSVPLSEFSSDAVDKTAITKVGFWDDPDGAVYYFDDICFVKELPADESNPMNGTAVKLCDFEDENCFAEASASETEAMIEDEAGCDGSKGLRYVRKTKSAGPSVEAGSVLFGSGNPVDITGLRYLVFYIKDMNGSNNPMIALQDADGNESNFSWTDGNYLKSVKETWTQFYVPLSSISGNIDKTRITGVRLGEWNQGTYYIDNVYFDNYLSTGIPGDGSYTVPTMEEKEIKVSVESGYYTDGFKIDLFSNKDEFVYYTTDGTEPKRTAACQYTGVIRISKSTVIKAFSVKDGQQGQTYTFDYKICPYPVTATSVPGTYEDQAVVEFRTKNDQDQIYYTTDGSEPDRNDTTGKTMQYIKPMLVTESTSFKAVAYDASTGEKNEAVTLSYTITNSGKTKQPVFSKLEGTYGKAITVALEADGEIYYTTDGSKPSEQSTQYTQPIQVAKDTTLSAIAVKNGKSSEVATASYYITQQETPFLKADGKVLKDNYGTGDVITLRGTNAGGWLVTEDWQCPTNAKDQLTAQTVFEQRFGKEIADELIALYQDNWWSEADFDLVKAEGMNVLRLPVTYFEMLEADGSLKKTAFDRMEWFIQNCRERGIYVLIDMHGAVGSQNGKDHSGDVTIPNVGNFYGNEENINKTIKLWEAIAKKYKDDPWVCGYDLLNEPSAVGTVQFEAYDRIYDAIRAIDKNHVIYIQAIWEPTHLPDPAYYGWQNVAYEYHFYGWHVEKDAEGQKQFIQSKVKMVNEDTNYQIPLLVGEFTFFSNTNSWKAMDIFEEQGWSYTSWTWKVTGKNSSWGMYTSDHEKVDIYNDSVETIRQKWAPEKLRTDSSAFERNDQIADILKTYYSKNASNKPDTGKDTDKDNDVDNGGSGSGNIGGGSKNNTDINPGSDNSDKSDENIDENDNKNDDKNNAGESKINKFQKKKTSSLQVSKKGSKAKLTWKKVSGADGYVVYQKVGKGKWQKVKVIKNGKTISYSKAGIKSGKTYKFRVRAYVKNGKKTVYNKYSVTKTIK